MLCSHVLEHVEDDGAAMAESPGAAPGRLGRSCWCRSTSIASQTYEDPAVTAPEDREREFRQHDHVRLYALDIADRLAGGGPGGARGARWSSGLPAGARGRYGLLSRG